MKNYLLSCGHIIITDKPLRSRSDSVICPKCLGLKPVKVLKQIKLDNSLEKNKKER